ncbi:alpha-protein kinase 2 [Salarias fasciatus]|uniref:alpha-protein kinase 2 n=1 Tax=Salarias fasciatus TaxID=181472 RepID=UPI001176DF93|nr:uncharacterized protein LOC115383460 [Salarias fasciatus]
MCDSTDIETQCHHGSSEERRTEINESGLKPPAPHAREAGLLSGSDAWQGKAEVEPLTPQLRLNDSPVELWLDACQYLAGETQVSGCDPDGSDGIGWADDDTRGWGPRVERWSSVDSWATALSDWTGIIEVPPEDFTAAFAEIGAEIDALTHALTEVNTPGDKKGHNLQPTEQAQPQLAMGVQDQAPKEQNIPESSFHSSQSCLSFCLEAPGFGLCDRNSSQSEESLCDSTQEGKYPEESESSPYTTSEHSFMGSSDVTVGSLGGYGTGSTCYGDLDVCQLDDYVTSLDTDVFISKRDTVPLSITEDTDLDCPAKTFRDGLCEVTDECSIPQLDWRCRLAEAGKEENQPAEDPEFFTTRALTGSRAPGVDTQPGQHFNVYTHLPFDTLPDLDGVCQVGPPRESPKFIMPLAPLSIGSSLVCRTSSSLEGDQTFSKRHLNDRDLSCELLRCCTVAPASDGITGKLSPESEELIRQKENTEHTAEKPSPEVEKGTSDASHCSFTAEKNTFKEITDLNRQLENLIAAPGDHLFISKKNRVACITLNLYEPFTSRAATSISIAAQTENQKITENMPHKTHKGSAENKSRSKKERSTGHYHGAQGPKKQDNIPHLGSTQQSCKKNEAHPATADNHNSENTTAGLEDKEEKLVIDTDVLNEKSTTKAHGKKKKKHVQSAVSAVGLGEPLAEVENGAKPKTAKGRLDLSEAKPDAKAQKDSDQTDIAHKKAQLEVTATQGEPKPPHHTDHQPKKFTSPLKDDAIKRRRLSEDKFGKLVSALESKLPGPPPKAKADEFKADVSANRKKAYSEVVKQRLPPKEELKVVQPIQAVSVSGDPQSLCLWCQFAAVFSDYTVTWSREGTVLAELKRSAGDESRVSVTISNASHKDLGKYQCRLSTSHGSVTLDYVLTYEVLSEIVIPLSPKIISAAEVELVSEEEDVQFSKLMFKEDFLSEQYFGENKPISILTEKVHFGEGMHRRAFRTKLHGGQIPLLVPGHPCVLKVHNSISYGTKNNEELIQKNFTLAVEECHVQNTAREYIMAYTAAAQAIEAFGDVPEIIPIYLIHRPSNDIPYATLEEELIGDFVKYSVKDGKEINLMRRDSEAGQKCCAFQHWVYQKTEGNLLVTDMQGVGMRLTDVGIATCKKGYKGFKGNCATSFIDQFKVLHQCNFYCELLCLKSLQPKPKKPAAAPKPKPQPSAAPKKKTFGPTLKGKS